MKNGNRTFPVLAAGLALSVLFIGGCDLMRQVQQAITFAKCEFKLDSVGGTTLAGVPIQGMKKTSEIGLVDLADLGANFKKGTLPLEFTANISVRNPNPSAASMDKLAWIACLDDKELTSGLVGDKLEVPAQGGVGVLPLKISVDLVKLLSRRGLDSMLNMALNVAGEGTRPTRITLKIKPFIMVGGQVLEYPGYVTVSREFTSESGKELRQEVVDELDRKLKGE